MATNEFQNKKFEDDNLPEPLESVLEYIRSNTDKVLLTLCYGVHFCTHPAIAGEYSEAAERAAHTLNELSLLIHMAKNDTHEKAD